MGDRSEKGRRHKRDRGRGDKKEHGSTEEESHLDLNVVEKAVKIKVEKMTAECDQKVDVPEVQTKEKESGMVARSRNFKAILESMTNGLEKIYVRLPKEVAVRLRKKVEPHLKNMGIVSRLLLNLNPEIPEDQKKAENMCVHFEEEREEIFSLARVALVDIPAQEAGDRPEGHKEEKEKEQTGESQIAKAGDAGTQKEPEPPEEEEPPNRAGKTLKEKEDDMIENGRVLVEALLKKQPNLDFKSAKRAVEDELQAQFGAIWESQPGAYRAIIADLREQCKKLEASKTEPVIKADRVEPPLSLTVELEKQRKRGQELTTSLRTLEDKIVSWSEGLSVDRIIMMRWLKEAEKIYNEAKTELSEGNSVTNDAFDVYSTIQKELTALEDSSRVVVEEEVSSFAKEESYGKEPEAEPQQPRLIHARGETQVEIAQKRRTLMARVDSARRRLELAKQNLKDNSSWFAGLTGAQKKAEQEAAAAIKEYTDCSSRLKALSGKDE